MNTSINDEFISEIVNILKKQKKLISASDLCMKVTSKLPLNFQPPKGYFQKWMRYLHFIERDDSINKDMPFYKIKDHLKDNFKDTIKSNITYSQATINNIQPTVINKVKEEQIIINRIKDDSALWYESYRKFKTTDNNIEMWNYVSNIADTINNNIKIIEDKYPNYLYLVTRYSKKMPPMKLDNPILPSISLDLPIYSNNLLNLRPKISEVHPVLHNNNLFKLINELSYSDIMKIKDLQNQLNYFESNNLYHVFNEIIKIKTTSILF